MGTSLSISEPKQVRVVAIALLAASVLFVFARSMTRQIRKGSEVKVTRIGKYMARRGTVVKVLGGGNLFEVRLHEARDGDAIIPSETVELYGFSLNKVLLHR